MRPDALSALDELSATIGRDPEQVQAAGGNTSLEIDGTLWVKASGLWLADALERDIFVPVQADLVRQGVTLDRADPVAPAVIAELNPEALRPSIETTLHALLPHRVVVHTHSVRTLALAIRPDAEALLAPRLAGLPWAFVPYCKPGLPLTRQVAAQVAEQAVDVLVLGNHGLVVGADDVDAATALLAEVEGRLDAPIQPTPAADRGRLGAVAASLGLRAVRHDRAHGLATSPARIAHATGGSYYPDHVIFLGPAARRIEPPTGRPTGAGPGPAARGSKAPGQPEAKLAILPGAGLLLPADATRSADEMALCLALVLERVPDGATVRRLDPDDEAALLDWDAEKYRQKLAGAH